MSRLRTASEVSLRLLLIAAAVAVVGYVLLELLLLVLAVVAALVLSTMFVPSTRWLTRRGWPRGLATGVTIVAGLVAFGSVLWAIGPPVAAEFGNVATEAQGGVDTVQSWLVEGPLGLSNRAVERVGDDLVGQFRGGAGSVSGVISGALVVTEVVTGVLLAIVLLVFFVKDGPQLWNWIVELVPERARPRARQLGDVTWETLGRYVRGVAAVALFDSVFIGLSLLLLGVPLVLPLMVLVFFGAFIPLVGAVATGALAALVALVSEGVGAALLVVVAITLVQQIEGNVLYPVVVGRVLELHPVVVIASITAGALVLGIVGAFIAVPLAAVAGRILAAFRAGAAPGAPRESPLLTADAPATSG